MDSNALLAEKIDALEAKYAEHDQQFPSSFHGCTGLGRAVRFPFMGRGIVISPAGGSETSEAACPYRSAAPRSLAVLVQVPAVDEIPDVVGQCNVAGRG